jgi:GNAT superfamily N-acetyltransferase
MTDDDREARDPAAAGDHATSDADAARAAHAWLDRAADAVREAADDAVRADEEAAAHAPATIRVATADDIPALRAILAAHDEDGPIAPGVEDIVGPYLAHLVRHRRVLVADLDDGSIAGFGAALSTGRLTMLTDLFVEPALVGRGIGRRLLRELFGGAVHRATFSSSDPRALPIYVRAGMTPLWPNLYVAGMASHLPDPFSAIRLRHAGPEELAELERDWTGAWRPADHAFWASQAAADSFVVTDGPEPVAFGYARARQISTARAVDRLVVRPGEDPVPPSIAALVRAGRGGPVQACVLGPSPLLPILLDAGFRVIDTDQFLASDPGLVDPSRLMPNPGML